MLSLNCFSWSFISFLWWWLGGYYFSFCVLFELRLILRILGLGTGGETLMVVKCRSSPNSKNIMIQLRQPFCQSFYLEFYLGGDWALTQSYQIIDLGELDEWNLTRLRKVFSSLFARSRFRWMGVLLDPKLIRTKKNWILSYVWDPLSPMTKPASSYFKMKELNIYFCTLSV